MKKAINFKSLFLLCICLGIWLSGGQSSKVVAQECTNSPTANKSGWARGQTVYVYIDPSITGDRRQAVVDAFNGWTASGNVNNSYITYQIDSTPPPAGTGYTVLNQTPRDGSRELTDTWSDDSGTDLTLYATTYLSPGITDPRAVFEAMSHAIGHPAGFADCETCNPSDSVMATKIKYTNDNDVIGRATSPTACDNSALAVNYPPCDLAQEQACDNSGDFWDPKTCTCKPHDLSGGGGGGGGGYDYYYGGDDYYYCTPYYWVWYESYDDGETWEPTGEVQYAGCW
jgi:hypothetical protein